MIEKVKAASAFLKERISSSPESAVILGSGLGSFADSLEGRTVIPYEEYRTGSFNRSRTRRKTCPRKAGRS